MKKIVLFSCISFFLVSSAISQSVNFSGSVSTSWGINAPGTKNAGDFSIGKTEVNGTLEAYMGDGTALVDGSVSYDAFENKFDFNLGEAYIDYSSSFWGVRVGFQKNAWGKADGINITNSVFPKDSSSLFNDDDSLSTKSVRLSFFGNSFSVDAFLIPFFTGNDLPLDENNPLRKLVVPSNVSINQSGTSMTIPVEIGNLSNPELNIKNMEYGLKASGYFSLCDVSLYGFYGWDKSPVLSYKLNTTLHPVYNVEVPESITVSGDYKRLAMIGLDAAFPIGPVVLRTETAFFPERHFQSSAESILKGKENSVKQNQLMALVGLDWMPSGWTITAQYYGDVIFSKSEDIERTDVYEHGLTLSVSKSLLNETLNLSFSGMLGFNNFDSALTGSADYSFSDQIKLSLGTYVFLPGPNADGTYGKFKDLSSIYIKAQYKW